MAQAPIYDEQGRLVEDPTTAGTDPSSGLAAAMAEAAPGVNDLYGSGGGTSTPAPAPASGTPQQQIQGAAGGVSGVLGGKQGLDTSAAPSLPEFGMGNMNMPPAPTFDQPDDASLVNPQSNGLSAEDQAVRSSADSIFGSDPGAPGGKYSGGGSRRANPLRETDIGKRFSGASKAGTAYGNSFDREGLLGGGKNATLAGGDNAELGQQPSDLLLQMLQLLGQG